MASVKVTVTPKSGKPRSFRVDDSHDPETGVEVRGGYSLIQTLRKRQQRGEFASVDVTPLDAADEGRDEQAPNKPARKATRAAAEAAE